ncbi:MAG: c-type cytochrome [Bacteroidetes bacterium]|nr:c-type cytochrome [Bacteroidota bacterium]MDA1121758.1 c-type cytochrome [Bacteroidota bacterium]
MKKHLHFYLGLLIILVSFQSTAPVEEIVRDEIQISVPDGFELEDLYSPSENDQGSWVSMAEGPNGLFYACDQYGNIFQFRMPEPGQVLDKTQVDTLNLEIGQAHGLLWAFNSLYVAVNRNWPGKDDNQEIRGSGVYRLKDSNNDGELDDIQILLKLQGSGEHGPHSMVVGPGGDEIYFIAGNHTLVPEALVQNSRLPNNWGEDNLLPPFLDARGHANNIKAPGGWIARTDPDGKDWELVSAGYRNPFDFAFNEDGELFAFDADMEWDLGAPWYRPIRVCHVTSGSEFGWRTGSGKWPPYYPDNLPAVVNLGQGSPTAIMMGTNLNFPAKYKKGLFVFDWSFGTMYFVDLQAKGSSYTGQFEEFLWGTPLPLTDGIAGSDGAMYFMTGGRNLESHLYRLRFTGKDGSTEKSSSTETEKDLRALRQYLESFHNVEPSEAAVVVAWENLNHTDRFIRYAARIALEHQPISSWQSNFFKATDPDRIIQSGIALARNADVSSQEQIIAKFNILDWNKLSRNQRIDMARATQLVLIRMGMPKGTPKAQLISSWSDRFPSADNQLDREMSQILIYLGAEDAVEKCVKLLVKHTLEKTSTHPEMLSAAVSGRSAQYGADVEKVLEKMPPTEATFYGTLLSNAYTGWTKELREKYFQWYYDILAAEGGASFKAFIENMRQRAMTNVPDDEKNYFQEVSGVYSPMADLANLPKPEGPGRNYNSSDINGITRQGLSKDFTGDINKGKRVFQAALCSSCHRMRGEGVINGPDLTQIHTRFERGGIIEAIFSPHEEISDQYAFTLLQLIDNKKVAGKIKLETDEKVVLMPNPFSSIQTVEVLKKDIIKQELSPVSPMPAGLVNRLNESELTELFAYLLSGADPEHVYYGGTKGFRVGDEGDNYKQRKAEKDGEDKEVKK